MKRKSKSAKMRGRPLTQMRIVANATPLFGISSQKLVANTPPPPSDMMTYGKSPMRMF